MNTNVVVINNLQQSKRKFAGIETMDDMTQKYQMGEGKWTDFSPPDHRSGEKVVFRNRGYTFPSRYSSRHKVHDSTCGSH